MHRLQGTLRRVAGFGVLGVAVSAVLAGGGCSSDDSGGGSGNPTLDASSDQTSSVPDASHQDSAADTSTLSDAGGHDGSLTNDAAADAMEQADVLPGDAAHDGSPADSSADAAPVEAGVDSSPVDSSPGGDAADSSTVTDGSSGSDASDASVADAADGGACVTSAALLSGGDGGVNDAGVAPRILFSFDPTADGGDAGLPSGFQNFSDANSNGTMTETMADGHPCSGALSLSVTYSAFGPKDQVYYQYSSAQDWTGYTKLHAWLKVETSSYATIQGVEPRVQSANFGDNLFGGFVSGSTFSDGGWHETIVPLTAGTNYAPASVITLQFELQTVGTATGDASVPPSATLLIDSIWLE